MTMTLDEKLEKEIRLTPAKKASLKNLGIETVRDLLGHLPSRYLEFGGLKKIGELQENERVSVAAGVLKIETGKTWKRKMSLAEAVLGDETGTIKAVWFYQPYLARMIKPGSTIMVSGKVSGRKGILYFANPEWQILTQLPVTNYQLPANLLPIYPETYGVSSEWLRYQIKKILEKREDLPDLIPPAILKNYHLPSFKRALEAVHFPKNLAEAGAARKRFSFEEIFLIQIERKLERKKIEAVSSPGIIPDEELLSNFKKSLPFSLTSAQTRVINQIMDDFSRSFPMNRLLEGDVGSGKTVVAAAASLAAASQGFQTAFMAPTEILARQHFGELIKRLKGFRVSLGLLTSSESQKFPSKVGFRETASVSKNQLLKMLASGDIRVIIGTHSLINEKVKFKKLGLVVIDEQHRFGTKQRATLVKSKEEKILHRDSPRLLKSSQIGFKKAAPHLLSMTATPIPRTLALTIYGDLDLSLLDEMPPGRIPVVTKIVSAGKREETYDFIRGEIKKGRQAFVICPRIEANDSISKFKVQSSKFQTRLGLYEMKAVKEEYKKLKEAVFPEFEIGMLHGRLKPKEKEEIMKKFKEGKINLLVSTSVVEVGIDVPNATIMMIEGVERFGLAQLHQFRGRVGRGEHQSYCFVFIAHESAKIRERLNYFRQAKNGFELAEYDLSLRGPGELGGNNQWGITDAGMEGLKNIKMVEAARQEAGELVDDDPALKKYPLLKKRLEEISEEIHFE